MRPRVIIPQSLHCRPPHRIRFETPSYTYTDQSRPQADVEGQLYNAIEPVCLERSAALQVAGVMYPAQAPGIPSTDNDPGPSGGKNQAKPLRFVTNYGAPHPKRRRIGAACLTCRKKKTACSGKAGYAPGVLIV